MRRNYILAGAAWGLLLGLGSAFFSPAGMKQMVPLAVQVAVVMGMAGLGALFGHLEYNARVTR